MTLLDTIYYCLYYATDSTWRSSFTHSNHNQRGCGLYNPVIPAPHIYFSRFIANDRVNYNLLSGECDDYSTGTGGLDASKQHMVEMLRFALNSTFGGIGGDMESSSSIGLSNSEQKKLKKGKSKYKHGNSNFNKQCGDNSNSGGPAVQPKNPSHNSLSNPLLILQRARWEDSIGLLVDRNGSC